MFLLAVPAGALAALQGGTVEVVGVDSLAPAATAATPTFSAPVQVVNSWGFEPSVRVDSKGTVYVAFARALPNPSWVFRSTDGGETWTKLPSPPLLRGAEPEIALGEDDTLYFSDLYVGNIVLAWYSPDGNLDGWTAVGETQTGVDRQWIVAGKGRELFVTTNDVFRGVNLYYTPDPSLAPATKPSPIVVGGHVGTPPAYDPLSGLTYTVYEATGGVFVARTNALQLLPTRFAITTSGDIANSFPSVAVDDAGNVFAVWSSGADGQYRVYLSWSTDRGQTWAAPTPVSGPSGTHVFPWVAANGTGRVAVAWVGTDDTGHPEQVPASAEWQVRVAQSVDVLSGSPTFATARATPTMHKGTVCVSGLSCDTAGGADRDLGDYIQIALGPDGMMHIAYTDDVLTQDGRIYHVKQVGGTRS